MTGVREMKAPYTPLYHVNAGKVTVKDDRTGRQILVLDPDDAAALGSMLSYLAHFDPDHHGGKGGEA